MRRDSSYSLTDLLLDPIDYARSIVPITSLPAEQEPWTYVGMSSYGEPYVGPDYLNGWYFLQGATMFRVLEKGMASLELCAAHDNYPSLSSTSILFTLPEDARPEHQVILTAAGFYLGPGDYSVGAVLNIGSGGGEPVDLIVQPTGEVRLRRALAGTASGYIRVIVRTAGTTARWAVKDS